MKKRLIAALMALCLLAGMLPAAVSAHAESFVVYIISNTLNAYRQPSTSTKVLGVMSYGEAFLCLSISGDWARIQNDSGAIGYCLKSGLSTENPNNLNAKVYINADRVPVYAKPAAGAVIQTYLNKNSCYTAIGATGDSQWYRLYDSGYYGYVQSQYVSAEPVSDGSGSMNVNIPVYVADSIMPAYVYPSETSAQLGQLSFGEGLICTNISGEWARVNNYSGVTFYCKVSNLTDINPNNLNYPIYINAANVPVYAMPSTGARVMMHLQKNASFTALGVTKDGAWYRLQNGRYYGYVQSQYISDNQITETPSHPLAGTTVYVIDTLLPAYQGASEVSGQIATLAFGTSYTLLTIEGEWAKISSGGASGYCRASGLSTENPNKLNYNIFINTGGVPVYDMPSTGGRVMMYLQKNASYLALGRTGDGAWYRLQNGKYYGYVQSQYVSDNQIVDPPSTSNPLTGATVYVTDTLLPAYQSASEASQQIAMLAFGTSFTLLNVEGNWARIGSGDASGYCKASGLSTEDPNKLNYNISINTGGIPVYDMPSTGGRVMMYLQKNSSYLALARSGDGAWYRLKNGRYFGYVQSQYVTDSHIENPPEINPAGTTVYIADDLLDVYASPSLSAQVVNTLSFGEVFTLLSVDDGWAKIAVADGASAYCLYGGLTTENPNKLSVTYYAQNNMTGAYARPSAGTTLLGTLTTDTAMTVVATSSSGQWARILINGIYAYVQMADISTQKVGVKEEQDSISAIDPITVYMAANTVVIYQSSSTSSKALATLSYGESLTCNGTGNGWARLTDGVSIGYCKVSELTTEDPNIHSVIFYVQKDGVKAYQRPTTSSSSLGTMSLNTMLTALCATPDGNWLRVKNSSGAIGYVQSAYLSTSMVMTSTVKADAVIALARQQMGKKYIYASEGPDSFDCSGLTYYCFKNTLGISLKRTAFQQGYNDNYAKITSISALQAGDLVFFNTSNDNDLCDHVGIYIGGNEFIHASSAGGRVMISSLSQKASGGYYYRCFSWGRRII